jgi:hypothetical protein
MMNALKWIALVASVIILLAAGVTGSVILMMAGIFGCIVSLVAIKLDWCEARAIAVIIIGTATSIAALASLLWLLWLIS